MLLHLIDIAAEFQTGVKHQYACVAVGLPCCKALDRCEEWWLIAGAVQVYIVFHVVAGVHLLVLAGGDFFRFVGHVPHRHVHVVAVTQGEEFSFGLSCCQMCHGAGIKSVGIHHPTVLFSTVGVEIAAIRPFLKGIQVQVLVFGLSLHLYVDRAAHGLGCYGCLNHVTVDGHCGCDSTQRPCFVDDLVGGADVQRSELLLAGHCPASQSVGITTNALPAHQGVRAVGQCVELEVQWLQTTAFCSQFTHQGSRLVVNQHSVGQQGVAAGQYLSHPVGHAQLVVECLRLDSNRCLANLGLCGVVFVGAGSLYHHAQGAAKDGCKRHHVFLHHCHVFG